MHRPPPANPATLAKARQLRSAQSDAERRLWWALRGRSLGNFKFRRQVPIGSYIVDFCCMSRKLIVEVDGQHHLETGEYDIARENVLRSKGFEVLRFSAIEVTRDRSGVVDQILQALDADARTKLDH